MAILVLGYLNCSKNDFAERLFPENIMPKGIPNSRFAKDNPVIMRQQFDTTQADIGRGADRVMRSTGEAKDSLDRDSVMKVMEQPYDDEKMAMLQFMNEPVSVRIAQSTDKNAEQCFEIIINKHMFFFRRGETKIVPRFVVDRLMRLKETRYEQKLVLNPEGIQQYIHTPITGLRYDFSIERDDNPLGLSWQRAVLAEPG